MEKNIYDLTIQELDIFIRYTEKDSEQYKRLLEEMHDRISKVLNNPVYGYQFEYSQIKALGK